MSLTEPGPSADATESTVDRLPGGPIGLLVGWARASSLAVVPFVGALADPRGASWADLGRLALLGRAPVAKNASRADLLVVVGQISHKAAPVLMRTHAAMAHPALVLHLPLRPRTAAPGGLYALVDDLEEILPVDVIVEGCPPAESALRKGLAELAKRAAGARAS